jgi:hypothetical protein
MPKLKTIAPRKKLPRVAKAPPKEQTVFDEKNPEDLSGLVRSMSLFIRAICLRVLDYPPEAVQSDSKNPLNLNDVHDKLMTLKGERDDWRTRCESIEAAFNALGPQSSGGSEHGQ